MKAVIILPTYNERENISSMLTSLYRVIEKIPGFTFEVLVVDDASPDGTGDEVKKFQKIHPSLHLITGKKEGLGRALLRGMTYAVNILHADIIGQMDADMSHDPASLPAFFDKIRQGDDFVVGSRYIPGGSIPHHWGMHRKIFSIVGNGIVRTGLGHLSLHDWTGGYRVFRKEFFEKAKKHIEKYSGYVFQIAFLHDAVVAGARVGEVPIQFSDRRYGKSKIAPFLYIRNVFTYVISQRIKSLWRGPFKKFAVVGSVGFVINTLLLELLVSRGFHPAFGSAVGAECAIVSNFIFNNQWTFRHHKISGLRLIPKFIQFNIASLGALVIQTGTVALGTHLVGVEHYRWFYLIGVGIGLLWNYTMYSKVIWKHGK